ncbi:hypothetical protein, partial [Sphingobacterium daejeonense]|uniref:hypothetical protein n=1 Tax=Sphingobacterium daejeonense TaxID=371142 RepID=UPI003D30F2B0
MRRSRGLEMCIRDRHIPKFREHFVRESLNAEYGIPFNMIPLLTVDEMILNRAEAFARICLLYTSPCHENRL